VRAFIPVGKRSWRERVSSMNSGCLAGCGKFGMVLTSSGRAVCGVVVVALSCSENNGESWSVAERGIG
jgi:hypothetical protein